MSRKNISIGQGVQDRAYDLIKARGFDGLSDLIATLIREEWERRNAHKWEVKRSKKSKTLEHQETKESKDSPLPPAVSDTVAETSEEESFSLV